jgi:hypothetical protein
MAAAGWGKHGGSRYYGYSQYVVSIIDRITELLTLL